MKKEEIDKIIIESLSSEEAEFYKTLEREEDVFEMWWNIYKGRNAWIAGLLSFLMFLFSCVAVYCGYYVFTEDSLITVLRYGAVMFLAVISVSMLKVWVFQQMDKNTILREMKRLEYQVAVLVEKMGEK